MCAKCSLEWTLRKHQWLEQFVWHLRTMRTCYQSILRKYALDRSGAGRNCQNAFKEISKQLKLFVSTDVGQLCVTVKRNCINSVSVMTEQFFQSSVVFRFWDTVRVMCKQRWSGFLLWWRLNTVRYLLRLQFLSSWWHWQWQSLDKQRALPVMCINNNTPTDASIQGLKAKDLGHKAKDLRCQGQGLGFWR